MNACANIEDAAIDRYVGQLRMRHPKTVKIYRSELHRFHRFIQEQGGLSIKSITSWVQVRAGEWPVHLLVDRACKVDRLLDFLVAEGTLKTQPFAELRLRCGRRVLSPIIHALLSAEPESALEELRAAPRFGSFLGKFMQEHIELRRSLGYRYLTQAQRFAAFDRFLQSRPDLEGKPLQTMLQDWEGKATTLEQRWAAQLLARDLTKAWSRLDPGIAPFSPDRTLRRRVLAERRRPYIYTHQQVCRLLETARTLSSPRVPLRPFTLHMMLVLAYCAGLRIGELVRLDLGDVSLDEAAITIRQSKFFKSRRLPLTDNAMSALRNYLHVRAEMGGPTRATSALFWRQTRQGGGRYARITAANLLVRILRDAGLKPAHGRRGPRVHDLRHSFVSHRMLAWYREGINPQMHLPYLATFLGHKDINSTLVYLNSTPDLLQLASERFRSYVQRCGSAERSTP